MHGMGPCSGAQTMVVLGTAILPFQRCVSDTLPDSLTIHLTHEGGGWLIDSLMAMKHVVYQCCCGMNAGGLYLACLAAPGDLILASKKLPGRHRCKGPASSARFKAPTLSGHFVLCRLPWQVLSNWPGRAGKAETA